MIRMMGSLLIGGTAAYMGISVSERLKAQLKAVSALRNDILQMRQKLIWYRLPLPAMLREVSVEQAGIYSAMYARAAARLETDRRKTAERILMECMNQEKGIQLPERAKQTCHHLFAALGKADAKHQEDVLNRTIEELDRLEAQLREDVRRQSRCWCALGICGGLAIAILLV